MNTQTVRLLCCAAILGGMILVGCAAKEAKWSGETASMVVYAKSIPLYPGARAKDAMGSESYGDEPDSYSEGMCVWFEIKDFDRAKVLAWYEERLPGAKTQTFEGGAIELKVPAPNGEPGEDMGVVVSEKDFRVFEHTRQGKHRKS